ncbi:MAG: 50S ribosomal protein L18 [Deferribacteres bacterium]|nr:50S ribosomal protein L18 [Deferribacteres bacterium]
MGFKKIDKNIARQNKHRSVRKKVFGTSERPRLVVYKSNKNIYAQLVDDQKSKTLTGVSSLSAGLKDEVRKADSRMKVATAVGKAIAEKAKDLKLETVVFDRGGYLYHGLVKALADGAREAGLKF